MRKVTRDAINAFYNHTPFRRGNTEVMVNDNYVALKLHGNTIAELRGGENLTITNAGWPTNTTKERLNGLTGVSIRQKNHQWYLNGERWDGESVNPHTYGA